MSRNRLETAIERIQFSRNYTKQFLTELTDEEWFWTPPGFVTHIAWQVAHLASSQYSLCLLRVRGRKESDDAIIPQDFFENYRIGSAPQAGIENNPPLDSIQRIFDAVHAQVLSEIADKTDEELNIPLESPHPAFETRLGAIEYSPQHELVHAGQIALLRRLMGKNFKR
ncbi:DinB family protein [Bythopirellula polymerisocia]|uniref:DinB superfamily protein n=1 Tax=Bythopirellula polymerisocia TaxID=2528003 RepID=A0A5C6D1W3_9BACT|nr:DinB family protein [Bythopirellula polymerisocia]TWU30125.1 DinB superfamily protein [Bythopirellula polymerisocia]